MAPLPRDAFAFFDPHPYHAAGAPYGEASPWHLRVSVIAALGKAQASLQTLRPGWKLMIFDAYRPNAVQAYMVEREFRAIAIDEGLNPALLTAEQRAALAPKVYRVWGIPSEDPATPPLHSTGGVVDLTLWQPGADGAGHEVDMGSPIDENSDRSNPDYFRDATDEAGQTAHELRCLLRRVMEGAGFTQLHSEWWHFSIGDQYWAWRRREDRTDPQAVAIYGRADVL